MFRGLDPSDVSLEMALGYAERLPDFYEREKSVQMAAIGEALSKVLGGGSGSNEGEKKVYRAP